jgi:Pyruvate/2-oxoacid:ferredoxin oxidoreductase delta subunit
MGVEVNNNLDRTGKLDAQTAEGKQEMERKVAEIRVAYKIHQDDGNGRCTTCGTAWPDECEVEKNAVWL